MSRAKICHRIQYRLFDELRRRLSIHAVSPRPEGARVTEDCKEYAPSSSISASMPWAETARLVVEGILPVADFRRYDSVCQVVETVGPPDGRFHARLVRRWGDGYLTHSLVHKMDRWGNPVRLPGWLLDTPVAFSPTTLRYLATALWLKRMEFVTQGCLVVELGVGYGGLAGMNALVSDATTVLVDLPQVENLAARFLGEVGLAGHSRSSADLGTPEAYCFLSNYAFTELSEEVQDIYFNAFIRGADKGIIVSNARIFSAGAGGRSDEDILGLLREAGLPAEIDRMADILGPSDKLGDISIIWWNKHRHADRVMDNYRVAASNDLSAVSTRTPILESVSSLQGFDPQ